jgi:hypothetical protein
MINYCNKAISSRSKYDKLAKKKCHLTKGHEGSCKEFPFLDHLIKTTQRPSNKFGGLNGVSQKADEFNSCINTGVFFFKCKQMKNSSDNCDNKRIADKIKRDSTMTTGAAWKSEDAGPNRILRWVMLIPDKKLLTYGINMKQLKPQVIAKLREKAADYDSCIQVSIKLTWLVYQMPGAPIPPDSIKEYLESHFGLLNNITRCSICLTELEFKLFHEAQRGKAIVETCHLDPRSHSPSNVGFAHRECNIAQGNKSIDEFYDWISGILHRARKN